jgi:hypothetical protein
MGNCWWIPFRHLLLDDQTRLRIISPTFLSSSILDPIGKKMPQSRKSTLRYDSSHRRFWCGFFALILSCMGSVAVERCSVEFVPPVLHPPTFFQCSKCHANEVLETSIWRFLGEFCANDEGHAAVAQTRVIPRVCQLFQSLIPKNRWNARLYAAIGMPTSSVGT